MMPRPVALAAALASGLTIAACTATTDGGVSGYGRLVAPLAPPEGKTAAEAVVGGIGAPRTQITADLAPLLDVDARTIALEAQYQALEDHGAGTSVRWRTPDSAVRGEVVPGPPYAVNAQRCRDFVHAVERDGNRWSRRGTACRGADGRWELIS